MFQNMFIFVYRKLKETLFICLLNCFQIRILKRRVSYDLTWNKKSFKSVVLNLPQVRSSLYPDSLQYFTMVLQRPRIIVGDARFAPGTSAPSVWYTVLPSPKGRHLFLCLKIIFLVPVNFSKCSSPFNKSFLSHVIKVSYSLFLLYNIIYTVYIISIFVWKSCENWDKIILCD